MQGGFVIKICIKKQIVSHLALWHLLKYGIPLSVTNDLVATFLETCSCLLDTMLGAETVLGYNASRRIRVTN